MIATAALQRLVEGFGIVTRVDEKHIGGVDGRDEDDMSGAFATAGSGCHIYGALTYQYCKYIIGSRAGTTFLQTWRDTQTAILQSRDTH